MRTKRVRNHALSRFSEAVTTVTLGAPPHVPSLCGIAVNLTDSRLLSPI